jgi:hypothetical protein
MKPDPDGKNQQRAYWAWRAIDTFQSLTGSADEEALQDLLCDLMHFADFTVNNFEGALFRARFHYKCETASQTGGEEDLS